MTEITVKTIPENKEDQEVSYKMQKIVEDRNRAIAKRFGMEEMNPEVRLYFSRSSIVSTLDPNGESMGVFAGYLDCSDYIMIFHPHAAQGLFTDTYKEMGILADYCLVKFYLCKKYFPQTSDFVMFYKYVSDVLASIVSGKFQRDIALFDIKHFSEDRKYKKEKEIEMVFFIMSEKGGISFLMENLDEIMREKDIRRSVFNIYKKSFAELIKQQQRELQELEKKTEQLKRRR